MWQCLRRQPHHVHEDIEDLGVRGFGRHLGTVQETTENEGTAENEDRRFVASCVPHDLEQSRRGFWAGSRKVLLDTLVGHRRLIGSLEDLRLRARTRRYQSCSGVVLMQDRGPVVKSCCIVVLKPQHREGVLHAVSVSRYPEEGPVQNNQGGNGD